MKLSHEKRISEDLKMSRKSASSVVSGFGFAMQIGAKMDEIRRRFGVTEEQFHVLATPSGEIHLEEMICGLSSCKDLSGVVHSTYPSWVVRHLTPELEAKSSSGVKNPGLGLHEKQEKQQTITGDEVFAFLLPDQKTYTARWSDPIHLCISLADIQCYEKYPHLIPLEWKRKLVYAWKSVVLNEYGGRIVPFLYCNVDRPYVDWYDLDGYWGGSEPAGLSAS